MPHEFEKSVNKLVNTVRGQKTPEVTVFFEIGVDGELLGRIVMRLFSEDAPKTCGKYKLGFIIKM